MNLSVVALLLALAGPATHESARDEGRLSLEDLLERYRSRRDARLGELRDQVGLLIAELDALGAQPSAAQIETGAARLGALGEASVPLLVPHLDPGPDAPDGALLRAQIVARVLRELPLYAVTGELLQTLEKGTIAGQQNALRVLARSVEPERVGPALRSYAEAQTGSRREGALAALAELGGAENVLYLGTLLKKEDGELVRQALEAVAGAGTVAVAADVHDLVRATTAGAAQVRGIVGYYRACPNLVGEELVGSLLSLARGPRTSKEDARLLFDLIGDHPGAFSSGFKKELRKVADTADTELAEGALIALVKGGDRTAKRDLLAPYDERVEESPNWARSYEERADVYFRIDDWKLAKKDYEEALRTGANSSRDLAEVYLQIARCYAYTGKLKEAREWIEKAPITVGQRRALAKDPAFAELAANPKYRDVFGLDK